MSHKINITNGKASFVSAKVKAWHGLGTVLPEQFTSEEAIKYGGLDYEVDLKPAGIMIDGQFQETPKHFATYRKDTGAVFGVVGSRYHVVQNVDAFKFFDDIVGQGEAIFETAGSLGQGETVFITAKLPDYIKVSDDVIEKYLLFTMAHDGSKAIQAMFTPVRVVCNNTLQAAMQNHSNRVTIRHTKSASDRLAEAHKIMGISNMFAEEMADVMNAATKIKLKDESVSQMIASALGLRADEEGNFSTRANNRLEAAMGFYTDGVGQNELCRGTLYGMYQAVTGFFEHNPKLSQEERFEVVNFGAGADASQKAFKMMEQLVRS